MMEDIKSPKKIEAFSVTVQRFTVQRSQGSGFGDSMFSGVRAQGEKMLDSKNKGKACFSPDVVGLEFNGIRGQGYGLRNS
jgi:hypothetical protein